jgi:hypothetical protein
MNFQDSQHLLIKGLLQGETTLRKWNFSYKKNMEFQNCKINFLIFKNKLQLRGGS